MTITVALELLYEQATADGQHSAAVAAVREQSILHGLRIERQEVAPAGAFETMTDKDYSAKIIERIQQALTFATARPPSDTEQ